MFNYFKIKNIKYFDKYDNFDNISLRPDSFGFKNLTNNLNNTKKTNNYDNMSKLGYGFEYPICNENMEYVKQNAEYIKPQHALILQKIQTKPKCPYISSITFGYTPIFQPTEPIEETKDSKNNNDIEYIDNILQLIEKESPKKLPIKTTSRMTNSLKYINSSLSKDNLHPYQYNNKSKTENINNKDNKDNQNNKKSSIFDNNDYYSNSDNEDNSNNVEYNIKNRNTKGK